MPDRADRLRADLKPETLTGAARALAEEAVLIVERLERLDATLQGDPSAWLGIQQRIPDVAELVINAPLAEARQQAGALRGLLDSLAKMTGQEVKTPALSVADDLKKRREERRKTAQG